MTIEIEIQNSKLKSKIKIEKVSLTRNQNQNTRLERLAPTCVYMGEHIAGLGAGWGRLGCSGALAWVASLASSAGRLLRVARVGAGIGAQRRAAPGEDRPLFVGFA
jgi:hypothetical protein